jgi:hypothetical protein
MHVTQQLLLIDWARMIADGFSVLFYITITLRLWKWYRNPLAGHKTFLQCVIWFWYLMAFYRAYWIIAVYFNFTFGLKYVAFLSTAAGGFLLIMVERNARQIENTLECSEKESKQLSNATNEFKQEMEKVNTRADALVERQKLHIAARQESYKHPKGA